MSSKRVFKIFKIFIETGDFASENYKIIFSEFYFTLGCNDEFYVECGICIPFGLLIIKD